MTPAVAYPVQILREHLTALEAAISVCLAGPDERPVHKLRTATRRIEALLLLLELLPDLPPHRKESRTLRRALKRLRRAAGSVRDLDVHRGMLETFADREEALAQGEATDTAEAPSPGQPGAAAPPAPEDGTPETTDQPEGRAALLNQSATALRKRLGRARHRAAKQLQAMLRQHQAKTAKAAEALVGVLEPAWQLALPAPDLLHDAEAILLRDGLLAKGTIPTLEEEDLHAVRKAAKKARYLAESLPTDPTLAAAAERFEALQESGGQWHDALEITQAARHVFGKAHVLTAVYRQERDSRLEAYRVALTAMVTDPRPARRRTKAGTVAPRPRHGTTP